MFSSPMTNDWTMTMSSIRDDGKIFIPATTTITTTTTRTFQATKSPRQLIRQTLQPPAKPLMGTSPNKNYSVQRFYEYYVDDASSRFYDAINEDEQRASFDRNALLKQLPQTIRDSFIYFVRTKQPRIGPTIFAPTRQTKWNKAWKDCFVLLINNSVLINGHQSIREFLCQFRTDKLSLHSLWQSLLCDKYSCDMFELQLWRWWWWWWWRRRRRRWWWWWWWRRRRRRWWWWWWWRRMLLL